MCVLAQMIPRSHFGSGSDLERYETLLQMTDILVRHRGLKDLFPDVSERLRSVTSFDFIAFTFHDPATAQMRVCFRQGPDTFPDRKLSLNESPSGWVWQNQQPLAIPDTTAESRFIPVMKSLIAAGIGSYCVLPLSTPRMRIGGLGLGSTRRNAYSDSDLGFLRRVGDLIAYAVENVQNVEVLQKEKERLQMLLQVNATLVSNLDLQKLFPVISGYIRNVVKQDYAGLMLYDEEMQVFRKYALDFPCAPDLFSIGQTFPVKDTSWAGVLRERQAKVFDQEQLRQSGSPGELRLLEHGMQSLCCVPLITGKGPLGVLNFAGKCPPAALAADIHLLKQIGDQMAICIEHARSYRHITELRDKLAEEKSYLEGEIRSQLNFEEIVGDSLPLKRILEQARTVAPMNATVLVLGETGTGKELIARAIHRMSTRKDGSFIKLNCAAIPTGLLESELFGHEKGAFTSAVSKKIGRLELAHKGTLFLDEVGEIPLELQPKLLRVLQDQEFERLGGTRTLHVDIRLVAATNRDLEQSISEKQFRSDLFYRLNVFPIRVPPLRERGNDIPQLVRHFVRMFARRMNKQIETIPTETMNAFLAWDWPGNIRELENFIERSVILSQGSVLNSPLAELRHTHSLTGSDRTLANLERQHIIRVLRETRGVIAGVNGAAARLGLKRTTLQSRLQRMQISREEYEN
jgi:formate hydrogenlyase transcriptional activator